MPHKKVFLWTQSLHILEKTRLYSAESVKFWHFPQSIGYFFYASNNDSAVITDWNSSE